MKRLAIVLAFVALGACKKAEQQPAQGQADSSSMMMSDTSKMMMSDSAHMMMSDTAKKAAAPTKKP